MNSAHLYTQRRKQLADQLDMQPIVLTAFDAMQQTNDSAAPFVQESSFFWLTGITEPGWMLIIVGDNHQLVAADKTDIQRIFDGGISKEEAMRVSGIKTVLDDAELDAVLQALARTSEQVFTILKHPHSEYFDFALNPAIERIHGVLSETFGEVHDCRRQLSRLKAIKTSEEIDLIKQAIAISIDGFNEVKKTIATAEYEYSLEATLTCAFRSAGAQGHAYTPIVATGKNACTLHYIENTDKLPNNGLVLIDAGAKVGEYAADITRTLALGTPSAREAQVHQAVDAARADIIALIAPGLSFKQYDQQVEAIMRTALNGLGLLKQPDDFYRYFPHAISHGLGIDVHDSLGGYETFQAGMVLTVEPGIYIPEEGIGVRLEDDILVTEEGNTNLTAALPTRL
jgi:Xaa-Pro aminopeptidase